MDEMIGYCGYSCHLCAARSEDPVVRQRLVDGWKRIFGHEMYTAENVKCGGCRGSAPIADKSCKARPCAIERGVESCALCDEFLCEKVRGLVGSRDGMLVFLHRRVADLSRDEYDLCMRQFDGMPNLIRIMADSGKLPAWMGG